MNIGILHPGAMGVSVGAAARATGHKALWASEGRSPASRGRAASQSFLDAGTLGALCSRADGIVCVCPPAAAEEVARAVAASEFRGLYVDANAISPERAVRVGALLNEAGVGFVDGGIIGGPAWKAGSTWLSLSGERAEEAAAWFAGGMLETEIVGREIGKASALKMCYAAYTKGTTALLCALLAAARREGVWDNLAEHWARDGWDLAEEAKRRAERVPAKAWRYEGEMREIAATLEAAGLPGGFHEAAAETYRRLARFKGAIVPPKLDAVLDALLAPEPEPEPEEKP